MMMNTPDPSRDGRTSSDGNNGNNNNSSDSLKRDLPREGEDSLQIDCTPEACTMCGTVFEDVPTEEWTTKEGELFVVKVSTQVYATAETSAGTFYACETCYARTTLEAELRARGMTEAEIAELHLQYALEYQSMERPEDAADAAHRALRLRITPDTLNTLALAYNSLGNRPTALELLHQALTLDPDHFGATQSLRRLRG